MFYMMVRDPKIPLLARRPYSRQYAKPQYSRRKLETFFMLAATLMTLVMMLHAARWKMRIGSFFLLAWAISPYLIMFRLVSDSYRREHDPPVMWIGRMVSVVLLVATALVYGDVTFRSSSSTGALVFVFFPLWLLVGGVAILKLSVLALKWRREEHLLPGHCQKCGYDLTGNVSGVCSECGTPFAKKGD